MQRDCLRLRLPRLLRSPHMRLVCKGNSTYLGATTNLKEQARARRLQPVLIEQLVAYICDLFEVFTPGASFIRELCRVLLARDTQVDDMNIQYSRRVFCQID